MSLDWKLSHLDICPTEPKQTPPSQADGNWTLTFQAADPPEARVGECPRVFAVLVVWVVVSVVGGAVADEGAGIKPIVCPDGHRHQAKGCKRPHGGKENLDPLLTPHHG